MIYMHIKLLDSWRNKINSPELFFKSSKKKKFFSMK